MNLNPSKRFVLGVFAVWLVFLVSFVCPAVDVDMGAWNKSEPSFVPGYLCAAVFWPFWLSNALMLLAPVILPFRKKPRFFRWTRNILAVVFALSFVGALACLPMFRSIHIGYILWTTSFAANAVAMTIPASSG